MELHLPPKPQPVVGPGEFQFAAVGLEHGHIYGMTNGLLEAGATLTAVWDEDPEKVAAYRRTFPQARAAASLDEPIRIFSLSPVPPSPASAAPLACG